MVYFPHGGSGSRWLSGPSGEMGQLALLLPMVIPSVLTCLSTKTPEDITTTTAVATTDPCTICSSSPYNCGALAGCDQEATGTVTKAASGPTSCSYTINCSAATMTHIYITAPANMNLVGTTSLTLTCDSGNPKWVYSGTPNSQVACAM